jgi:hypothetical protein
VVDEVLVLTLLARVVMAKHHHYEIPRLFGSSLGQPSILNSSTRGGSALWLIMADDELFNLAISVVFNNR